MVATVNGKPLTELDLLYKLKTDSHQDAMKPEFRQNVLGLLIRDELVLQRGLELGLDADPSYAEPVRKLEVQLAALRRKQMADLYFRHEIAAKVEVSEAEAKRYFDAHQERISTQLHVLQILRRTRGDIEQAKQALDGGARFEEVARSTFPGLAEGQTPWDLGYLRWVQVPPEWRDAIYAMKPGETSAILTGQKDRFWIVKLVDLRKTDAQFESEKQGLMEILKSEKLTELRAQAEQQLRARAKIVYHAP